VGIAGSILEANKNLWGGIIHKGYEGGKGLLLDKKKEKPEKAQQWKH
jgi:hypothetical protein